VRGSGQRSNNERDGRGSGYWAKALDIHQLYTITISILIDLPGNHTYYLSLDLVECTCMCAVVCCAVRRISSMCRLDTRMLLRQSLVDEVGL